MDEMLPLLVIGAMMLLGFLLIIVLIATLIGGQL